ncbi:MAG: phage holin family protein [Fimbriimonadaceae bacterium]
MKKLLIRWILLVISIIAASYLTNLVIKDGIIVSPTPQGVMTLFIGSAFLAIVNATLGNFIKFISFPISCLTLGLFALVINAALFWAVGSLGMGYTVNGFLAAFVGSVLVSAVSGVLGAFVSDDKKEND